MAGETATRADERRGHGGPSPSSRLPTVVDCSAVLAEGRSTPCTNQPVTITQGILHGHKTNDIQQISSCKTTSSSSTPNSKLPKAKRSAEISQISMSSTRIGPSLESGC